MIDRLTHHGEAMVILAAASARKVSVPTIRRPTSAPAQTALTASARAVRHMPKTLLALCSRLQPA
jgi:hypothetical protein